jgi:hypothetical protein
VNNTTIRNLTFHVHKIVVPLISCRTDDIIRCLYLKMKRPCLYFTILGLRSKYTTIRAQDIALTRVAVYNRDSSTIAHILLNLCRVPTRHFPRPKPMCKICPAAEDLEPSSSHFGRRNKTTISNPIPSRVLQLKRDT